jgi:hypothetical protein
VLAAAQNVEVVAVIKMIAHAERFASTAGDLSTLGCWLSTCHGVRTPKRNPAKDGGVFHWSL